MRVRLVSHKNLLLSKSHLTKHLHTVVYVCPSCQEKTGRRTVSKYQTRFDTTINPIIFLPYCCTLSSCNNPLLHLLVPVFRHDTSWHRYAAMSAVSRLSCMCPYRTGASCVTSCLNDTGQSSGISVVGQDSPQPYYAYVM
jgi:hypothetical protein